MNLLSTLRIRIKLGTRSSNTSQIALWVTNQGRSQDFRRGFQMVARNVHMEKFLCTRATRNNFLYTVQYSVYYLCYLAAWSTSV